MKVEILYNDGKCELFEHVHAVERLGDTMVVFYENVHYKSILVGSIDRMKWTNEA